MKKIALLITALFLTTASYGQVVLISWDMAGVDVDTNIITAPYTLNGVAGTTDISGGALTLSSSVNPSTTNNQYGFKISGANEETSLSGAISANHYLQFTMTAAEGKVFTVTSVNMNGQSDATGADNVAIFADVNGFTDVDEIDSVSGISGDTGGFDTDSSGFGTGTLALSGSQYQNLSSITFRIYGWNTTSGSGSTFIRNLSGNDLVINGTTAASAVPEPSTYALIFGAATLGFVMYRRRAKRA